MIRVRAEIRAAGVRVAGDQDRLPASPARGLPEGRSGDRGPGRAEASAMHGLALTATATCRGFEQE